MASRTIEAFVTTVPERCRVCYTCVRECPAKAIRIVQGQAEVLPTRCVACGNCVRVCSQQAKIVRNTTHEVLALLEQAERGECAVAACIAPSFPAAYPDLDHRALVGMVRALGFGIVSEVAFGADLVAREYRRLLSHDKDCHSIATSCPAVVGFVERYHPDLVPALAPIVSPMVAMARALRRLHGSSLKIVFFGPCIAKKCEAHDDNLWRPEGGPEIDAASTFLGLNRMLDAQGIRPGTVEPSDFDPPHGGYGGLFPISKGMLQAANISEDLVEGEVMAASGRESFVEALKEFESGAMDARLLEILACNGCIMGPGMSNKGTESPMFSRRAQVSRFVREVLPQRDPDEWHHFMKLLADLDLSRSFSAFDQRIPAPSKERLAEILAQMGKHSSYDELNCGACGYDTCREHAIAIHKGLAENKMCLPFTIEELNKSVHDLAVSHEQLALTQEALVQSEKLASMGQLAAGIAHELNNPLGVVLMYAHLILEDLEASSGVAEDIQLIAEQADRCKKIVAGLLHFARQNKVQLKPCDMRQVISASLRGVAVPDNIQVRVENEMADPVVPVDRDQLVQVFTNLMSNACGAMPEGGTLTLRSRLDGGGRCIVSVTDTGRGIPKDNIKKIFEPFFTTKQLGLGTGLGLAVAYGIIKMHSGDIQVESNADPNAGPTTTTFTVSLPLKPPA